jgi:glycosyltransferase involved in cell wall biosynthesis
MKICFLMVSHWTGNLGGAEVQVRYLMEHLRLCTQHQLSFVCRYADAQAEHAVEILRTHALPPFGRWSKAADYFSVRRHLRRLMPDVIYTRVSSPYVGFAAAHCQRYGARHVHHIARIEDVMPVRPGHRRPGIFKVERPIYEYGLRRAHAVIAQAKYQDDLLRQHYARPATAVIPNFHPIPDPAAKDSAPLTVAWVANLKRDKRPEAFLNLARRCRDMPGVRFVMVGAVQDREYTGAFRSEADVPNFRYLGPRTLDEVNAILQQAHIFVNTSRLGAEGFPNTFIQSWLRSAPVLSLEVNPDGLLSSGELGLCAGGEFDRLVSQLRSLLGNPAGIAALGVRAAEFARVNYGLDNCRRIVSILEDHADTERTS